MLDKYCVYKFMHVYLKNTTTPRFNEYCRCFVCVSQCACTVEAPLVQTNKWEIQHTSVQRTPCTCIVYIWRDTSTYELGAQCNKNWRNKVKCSRRRSFEPYTHVYNAQRWSDRDYFYHKIKNDYTCSHTICWWLTQPIRWIDTAKRCLNFDWLHSVLAKTGLQCE